MADITELLGKLQQTNFRPNDLLLLRHFEISVPETNNVCQIKSKLLHHRAGASALHRQAGLGAVQGLDLTFLINREHHRMRRRVDVKPHHIAHLGGKLRVAAELKGPQPVRR